MQVIISPARNVRLAYNPEVPVESPRFLPEAEYLAQHIVAHSPWQLESLLDVSPKRAFELYDAYRGFATGERGAPAILSYYGAAFREMNPGAFTPEDLAFAQKHLRIFSALYGLLRPLDGILEHRLDMNKVFQPAGQNLYDFWDVKIHGELFATGEPVINLASLEYAKLVMPHMGTSDVLLTCKFLQGGPGGPKGTVSTVRAARGKIVRYIVKNRIASPQGLQDFAEDGYQFAPLLSTNREYVFVKNQCAGRDAHG